MSDTPISWQPPPRPEWLLRFNAEGQHSDLRSLVPLRADELIATACRTTGLSDFGDDRWREPFEVLLKSLDEEAELHYFGRLMTRNDLLIWLQALLGVQAAFTTHPEIAEERIDRPVVIAGLSRSGTSILFELMSRDPRFGSPRHWEMMFPCPPPEQATYDSDPRIERCQHLITQWNRVTPTYATMHEMDARLPNECIIAQSPTFVSEYIPFLFQVPAYMAWLGSHADWEYPYQFYRKLLQLWQWRNPRQHWLLKAPSHLNYLPTLFKVFPDARVLLTHRDPLQAQASVTNLAGTFYWMRSDKPLDVAAFEGLLSPQHMAARLERVIDWIEDGIIPRAQCASSRYADLIDDPLAALRKVYLQIGLPLDADVEARMASYLAGKPKGKFGAHAYSVGDAAQVARARTHFARYQRYFNVPDEA
ncbi:MAG: sulfotransferase [Proteobacteria bacterium]|nr:sulfotransferase [Pseudomonadota bacterium]HQR04904.1 sulfotransferase [Rhodocyclaceae bacterium]